ncbi:hypothetical protein BU25DRAFT_354898, partial [Macroventuria anomochaeta]
PYALPYAQLGGLPTRHPELPILVMFLATYCTAWLYSLYIVVRCYQRSCNNRIAVVLLLACGERITAYIMRIVWIFRISDIRIGIASQILLQAGVILVYVGALLSAASLLRVHVKCLPWLTPFLITLSIVTIISFVANLVSTIVSVHTLQDHVRQTCRDVQRVAATYLVFLTFISVLMLVVVFHVLWTRQKISRISEAKTAGFIFSFVSIVCLLMASFKAGVIWKNPSPLFSPAWYLSLSSLYSFELGPELLVTLILLGTSARVGAQMRNAAVIH